MFSEVQDRPHRSSALSGYEPGYRVSAFVRRHGKLTPVKRYLRQGGWQPYQAPARAGTLDDLVGWLQQRFLQHRGNCDVVRQDLMREHGLEVSLRTVQRAVAHLRQDIQAQSVATIRFETPPGHQLQIDFGTVRITIAGEAQKVHLFAATLGYSRRTYVAAFLHERQSAWLDGLEGAFRHFGGLPGNCC